MRIARIVVSIFGVISIAALAGSWPLEAYLASKARLFQRVEPSEAAALFGDTGNLIGSPQEMIVENPGAELPGKGPSGSTLLNDKYLREHGIYPLQLKTVRFFGAWLRIGASVGLLATIGIWLLLRRRNGASKPAIASDQTRVD